jgi:hypothetical protein
MNVEMLPMLPISNVANIQLGIGFGHWQHLHIGNILRAMGMLT